MFHAGSHLCSTSVSHSAVSLLEKVTKIFSDSFFSFLLEHLFIFDTFDLPPIFTFNIVFFLLLWSGINFFLVKTSSNYGFIKIIKRHFIISSSVRALLLLLTSSRNSKADFFFFIFFYLPDIVSSIFMQLIKFGNS